ncbi:MAG: hypothetical protein K8T89_16490 [Planctomycetes bacterium]|nr:hypothetical protein [Planctomycetota bacterium]
MVAIGGLLGFVCALTPYFYHTTSWHLTQRGFLLFVKTMLGYNLPGGDKLVAMEDIEFDARGIGTNHARFEMLKGIGGRYGFLVGLPAGLIAAHYFPL